MTIEEMRARKRELGLTNERVAELSGVPLGTVQKIFAGVTRSPRRETILALEQVLKELTVYTYPYSEYKDTASVLAEAASVYRASDEKQPGEYTLADYYAIPDERRVELIDGVIYDMSSPAKMHQMVLGQLYLMFAACAEQHPECDLYFAPLDVRLDRDNRTMVQPDLMIVCHPDDDHLRYVDGPPDFVLEVLSPSNPGHDLIRKLNKYWNAGVREYWVVDPEEETIRVWEFPRTLDPTRYTFADRVPVGISEGACVIDFSGIHKKLQRFR